MKPGFHRALGRWNPGFIACGRHYGAARRISRHAPVAVGCLQMGGDPMTRPEERRDRRHRRDDGRAGPAGAGPGAGGARDQRSREGVHARRGRLPFRAPNGHRGPGGEARLHPGRDRGPAHRGGRGVRDAPAPGDPRHQPGVRLRPGRRGDDDHRQRGRRRAGHARPGHLRLDRAVRPGRDGRLPGRARRPGRHRAAQAPGNPVGAEVRVSSEFEVQVTEEFEVEAAQAEATQVEAALRIEHASPDRTRARELFERLAELPAGDPERARIRGYLVELHLPLVEYLARRFRNRGEWLDDLTQVATIGLIKSIDRFDLERGVEFSTYATPTIVGEIKRHFRDKGWAVRVPRRLQELKLSLTKAIGELAQREGRAPTVSELAAHLQMTEEEVLEGLESANAYSTVSLDAPDSGDEDAPAVADSLGMIDEALEGVEYRESLKPLLERLPPREKKILLLRFFGNMTQSQIAAELGISQMHVSRLLARTLAQLREGLTVDD